MFISWHESWCDDWECVQSEDSEESLMSQWWLWHYHKLVAGRFENKKLTERECRLLSGSFKPDICPTFRAEMQSRAMPATRIKKRKALWCSCQAAPRLAVSPNARYREGELRMVPGIGDCQASSRIGLWKERGERERAGQEGRGDKILHPPLKSSWSCCHQVLWQPWMTWVFLPNRLCEREKCKSWSSNESN